MSKPNYDSTFGFRSNWINGAARSLHQNHKQTDDSNKQDSRTTESDKPTANSKTDKSYYEGPVKNKHSGCPLEPFKITLALIEQMTNEASE